jgi:hypothetical protein
VNLSSVVPIRGDGPHDGLRTSLRGLGATVEVILAVGSGPSRRVDA